MTESTLEESCVGFLHFLIKCWILLATTVVVSEEWGKIFSWILTILSLQPSTLFPGSPLLLRRDPGWGWTHISQNLWKVFSLSMCFGRGGSGRELQRIRFCGRMLSPSCGSKYNEDSTPLGKCLSWRATWPAQTRVSVLIDKETLETGLARPSSCYRSFLFLGSAFGGSVPPWWNRKFSLWTVSSFGGRCPLVC